MQRRSFRATGNCAFLYVVPPWTTPPVTARLPASQPAYALGMLTYLPLHVFRSRASAPSLSRTKIELPSTRGGTAAPASTPTLNGHCGPPLQSPPLARWVRQLSVPFSHV